MKSNPLPIDVINERLYYDLSSPTLLRWKINIGSKIKKDSVAGWLENNNYYRITLCKNRYLISRILYYFYKGVDPGDFDIDHVDGNPLNNQIDNLRLVTVKLNCRNRKMRSDNDTGVSGVHLFIPKTGRQAGQEKYLAQCRIQGKTVTRSFAVLKYGKEEAFRLACEARNNFIKIAQESGEGYTNRHGT